jgi:uncharacterized protein (TIRG00374 family)
MAKIKRNKKSSPLRQLLNPRKIIIPIAIGLGLAGYKLYTEVDFSAFANINFGWTSILWLFMAFLMVVCRDLGYMYRLRILSGKEITWRSVFDDIMLWEFSSAITPGVVGGSGVAIFILNKEGIAVGRSTAIVMTTALLDEIFYVTTVPILFLLVGTENLFPAVDKTYELFGYTLGIKQVFWVGYGFILVLISSISFGIFINPKGLKSIIVNIFKLPGLRKKIRAAYRTGDELITTSAELKGKPFKFWASAMLTTYLSWISRFMVANFILLAFTPHSLVDSLIILSRQLIMWVIMLISPTPGGEGIAQLAFESFLSEYTHVGLVAAIAIIWRLYTYYPYLFMGALVLPNWIQRVYLKRKLIRFKS